jgi:hypothetical protein
MYPWVPEPTLPLEEYPRENGHLKGEKSMLRSFAIAALITLGGGLFATVQAQSDVSGTWTLTIVSAQGSNPAPIMFEQDGDMLKGTFGEAPIEGTVTDSEIKWTTQIDAPQIGPMTLTFTGMVDGSDMKGNVDFGGFMSGTWTAVKE